MDKITDPEYWHNEIEQGRAAPTETGPVKPRNAEAAAYIKARLIELNTERLLLKMRKTAGLTQNEVATLLGTSRPAVSQNENKPITGMTVGSLVKYARACGYELDLSKAITKI